MDITRKARRRAAAYRRVFLTPAGTLTPDAEIVLMDLMDQARFLKPVPLDILPSVEGGRQMIRHLLTRLKVAEALLAQAVKQSLEDAHG